jgi:hypothetical protein
MRQLEHPRLMALVDQIGNPQETHAQKKFPSQGEAEKVEMENPDLKKIDVWSLGLCLRYLTPDVHLIDGLIFIDTYLDQNEDLLEYVKKWPDTKTAQLMYNEISVSNFLDQICGNDYDFVDPGVSKIVAIFQEAISAQVLAKFPKANFRFETFSDDYELTLWLVQDAKYDPAP